MGTWDWGSFGNDTAVDWSYGLEGTTDLKLVERTLRAAADEKDTLDISVAEEAVAAAEVVAGLLGRPGVSDSYSATVDAWVKANPLVPPPELVELAINAVTRVLLPPSELHDEANETREWPEAMEDLLERLHGS